MSDKRTGKKAKKVAEPKVAVNSTDAATQRVTGGPPARAPGKPGK